MLRQGKVGKRVLGVLKEASKGTEERVDNVVDEVPCSGRVRWVLWLDGWVRQGRQGGN